MSETFTPLRLEAIDAQGIMQPNPVHIFEGATIAEAAATLTDREFSSMPVLDARGHVVGTISRSDIVRELALLGASEEETGDVGATSVRALMSPTVFVIGRDASALEVVRALTTQRMHRLFVLDEAGLLVGVISALDVISRLEALEL